MGLFENGVRRYKDCEMGGFGLWVLMRLGFKINLMIRSLFLEMFMVMVWV